MRQLCKKKKFTVEVVHFKEGNGHFIIKEGDKLIARERWLPDRVYYEVNIIPQIEQDVRTLLEKLKF